MWGSDPGNAPRSPRSQDSWLWLEVCSPRGSRRREKLLEASIEASSASRSDPRRASGADSCAPAGCSISCEKLLDASGASLSDTRARAASLPIALGEADSFEKLRVASGCGSRGAARGDCVTRTRAVRALACVICIHSLRENLGFRVWGCGVLVCEY